MNVALIIAGGNGTRAGGNTPKQFVPVNGVPIIAYTLNKFQNHPSIDAICVVTLAGYQDHVRDICKRYNINKLKHITIGGASGQESIYNGLVELNKHYDKNDMVLIHDAVRPIIPGGIIDDVINTAKKYGNAISCEPCYEAIINASGSNFIPHAELMRAQAPQCFKIGEIMDAHNWARQTRVTNSVTSATLMMQMGKKCFPSTGSNKNIKITTSEDFEIFQAILNWNPNEYDFNI